MSAYDYAKACAKALVILVVLILAVSASPETDNSIVPLDHWSVKAVQYLYEQELCDNWAGSTVKTGDDKQVIPHRVMAILTIEAYLRMKMRIVNGEEIKPVCWLMLEGLAAQYAEEIADNEFNPKDMVALSRIWLKTYTLAIADKGPFPDIPDDYWVMEGYKLVFSKHGYPTWGGSGRTMTKYETAMLIIRAISEEKKLVDDGAVIDAGLLVMYESAVQEMTFEITDLEKHDDSFHCLTWLRSQPEYPKDLTG